MAYEFKPIKPKYTEKGDLVKFNYSQERGWLLNLLSNDRYSVERKTKVVGYIYNISPDKLRISMYHPANRELWEVSFKDFKTARISDLKRLEVILAEEVRSDDIPF
ncbi:hypothetical protein HYX17_05075 [Candidatus Woesearchaeota archaeon]|nr:hypothetical protein [Candidatus Woesearchaeota archaeon]